MCVRLCVWNVSLILRLNNDQNSLINFLPTFHLNTILSINPKNLFSESLLKSFLKKKKRHICSSLSLLFSAFVSRHCLSSDTVLNVSVIPSPVNAKSRFRVGMHMTFHRNTPASAQITFQTDSLYLSFLPRLSFSNKHKLHESPGESISTALSRLF